MPRRQAKDTPVSLPTRELEAIETFLGSLRAGLECAQIALRGLDTIPPTFRPTFSDLMGELSDMVAELPNSLSDPRMQDMLIRGLRQRDELLQMFTFLEMQYSPATFTLTAAQAEAYREQIMNLYVALKHGESR